MTAKEKFKKGDRVMMTPDNPHYHWPVKTGTVGGFDRTGKYVHVRHDMLSVSGKPRAAGNYHHSFWEVIG